jgi:hypothetical protein
MTTATTQSKQQIAGLFQADVTRDIPPVIYFHEQTPEKLADEVNEYIITGGFPEGHPHHKRVPNGIHEQYVHLLTGMTEQLDQSAGADLPSVWISGFYGSGKSSFAKLLGLSLDGRTLPDGSSLADRLLARDTSPKAAEFDDAWGELLDRVDPLSVVFDVGGTARDNEQIHSAVLREVQKRLGYCSTSPTVAEYELKLERDGHWDAFLEVVDEHLGKPWEEARDEEMAEDVFSRMMHHLFPENFDSPTAWFESRIGLSTNWSPNEATDAIGDMLEHRAPSKDDKPTTLFIVVDEVSQYIHQDDQRMLRLQSFVSALGQRLKGHVWLLVTGQEKLEEESESTVLGKLKGRFKPRLRVHLDATNIRDVVHERLLQKTNDASDELGALFNDFRHNLKLYAYKCQNVTEEEFVEVYPLLPAHIDLLMEITSAMRTRSTRTQGDTHAIRGLIQLLGELFREKELADRPVGTLITFDDIYDVQESALDVDTQNTMTKIRNWYSETEDEDALRVAKVVALLQLIQDIEPTTAELTARCLYDRLDRGNNTDDVEAALERLRKENLVSYSEKHGYKLQSSAGQEWAAERDKISLTSEDLSERVQDQLKRLIAETSNPRLKGTNMGWSAWFSDNRGHDDVALRSVRGKASVPVDFRFVGAGERSIAEWTRRSGQHNLEDRMIWVVGEAKKVDDAARNWGKSQRMIQRYDTRRESLSPDKQRLLIEERQREERLRKHVREAIEDAFMQGALYFRGQDIAPRDKGGSFRTALHRVGGDLLPELYPHYTSETVTEAELKQLLAESLHGADPKFMEDGLGILRQDNGRYEAHCGGSIPAQIERTIQETSGINGATLFAKFTDQPYGYHPSLVQAALAGLLRGRKIFVEPEGQSRITSYKDPGTQTLFTKISELRRADYYPAGERSISPRDRVKIRQLFEKRLGVSIAPEEEAIADSVYNVFPGKEKELGRVRRTLSNLPGDNDLPESLIKLERALQACRGSRQIEPTVERVKQHFDALNDGFQQLGIYSQELVDDAIEEVVRLHDTYEHHYRQLEQADALTEEVRAAGERIDEQLGRDKPWREAVRLRSDVDTIQQAYADTRADLLSRCGRAAETRRESIKLRDDVFAGLDADQKHYVLRPITGALTDTQADATHPTLASLEREMEIKLPAAEREAHERLDELGSKAVEIEKVEHRLNNVTIQNEDELEIVLGRLRKSVLEKLEQGHHVRLL